MSEEKSRPTFRVPQILFMVGIGIVLIAVVIGYMDISGSQSKYNSESPVVTASIAAIKGEIEELKARPPVERDEVADILLAAQEKGIQVAKYQNDFKACFKAADPEAALQTNYAALMKLFDATDGTGWSAWFRFKDKTSTEALGLLNWEFMTNYTIGVTELPCMWMLRDGAGELIAYTTGVYDGNLGVFKDSQTFKTDYGIEHYTDYKPTESQDTHTDDINPLDVGTFGGGDMTIGADGSVVMPDGSTYSQGLADETPDSDWASHFESEYSEEYADVISDRRQAAIEAGILNPDGTPKTTDGGEQP